MPNTTSIPAPRVGFIDERTGLMSREWYRFFLNLFTLTGSGGNAITLDDVQLGPAVIVLPDDANLVGASNLDSQVAQLAVDLQSLSVGPVAQPVIPPPAGTIVLLGRLAIGASTTTTAVYAALGGTLNVITTRAGSTLRCVYNDNAYKLGAGSVFIRMLQNSTQFVEILYSYAFYGYVNNINSAYYTPAYPTAGTAVAVNLQWYRDTAGDATTLGYGMLEVYEVYA